MKKVLIISYYWPPSGGPGVQRWVKFAKYLSRLNVETLVLTVNSKYATYPQIDESLVKDIPENVKVFYSKSFDLYSLYKKVSSNKEVPYGGFANTRKVDFKEKILRFIRGNFFLPDPRKGWNKYAIKKAKEIIKEYNVDTIVTTSPPHSTQLIGLKLKKQLGIKWIADFRDPWTDIFYLELLYPTRLATLINKKLEKKVLRKADNIVTVSDDLKRLFCEKLKNNEDKITVIPNGYDIDDFSKIKLQQHKDLFYISYIGTISNDYTIDGLIDGINQLKKAIKDQLRLRFVGKLSDQIYNKMILAGLEDKIENVGYVEHTKAIEYMLSTNVLLLIIPNLKNNEGILTGKLFEYIASTRPILFIGPEDGDAANIIKDTNSGVICSYTNAKQIAQNIESLYLSSRNPEDLSSQNPNSLKYSRENLTRELIKII